MMEETKEPARYGDTSFYFGQLVWAKMKGFSAHPAVVINEKEVPALQKKKHHKNQIAVQFFQNTENNFAFVGTSEVEDFFKHREERSSKNKTKAMQKVLERVDQYIKDNPNCRQLEQKAADITTGEDMETAGLEFPKQETPVNNKETKGIKKQKKRGDSKKREVEHTKHSGSEEPQGPRRRSVSRKNTPTPSLESGDDMHQPPSKKQKKAESAADHRKTGTGGDGDTKLEPLMEQECPESQSENPKKENAKPLSDANKDPAALMDAKSTAPKTKRLASEHPKVVAKNLGFVGQKDAMAAAILKNLVSSGHKMTAWFKSTRVQVQRVDKDPPVDGVHEVNSPAEVVFKTDFILCYFPDEDDLPAAFLSSSNGIIATLKEEKICHGFIMLSPLSERTIKAECQETLEHFNVPYLDALIIGTVKEAEQNNTMVVVSGSDKLFEELKSVWNGLAESVIFTGDAQITKSAVDMVKYCLIAGITEAQALLNKGGIKEDMLSKVLRQMGFQNLIRDSVGGTTLEEDPIGTLAGARKDMKLVVQNCLERGVIAPVSMLVQQRLEILSCIGGKGSDGVSDLKLIAQDESDHES